jgi:PAS domain S-box-containing protein
MANNHTILACACPHRNAVAAATALQLPVEIEVPGEPFLLNFIAVVACACGLGRMPGFVATAQSTIVSLPYFEPVYSFKLAHAIDLLAVGPYAAMAALSVEAFCRLVDIAIEANSARTLHQEAQARVAAIVTSSNDAIVAKTLDGIVTSWNEAAERMFGFAAGEMIGQSIRRVIPADRQQEENMILACLARGERIENYETVRIAKDRHPINVSVTVSPIRDEGRIIGASKIVRDITERKYAEELLRRQAHLLDQSHDAIFTWKIGGGIAYWSRGAETLYGYTAGEAIGQSSHELLRTRSPIPMQEVEAQTVRQGGWHGELTHTTRDGRTIMVESRHVRVSYDGETYALETNRDVTARKQAESRLAEREAQLASFIEHAPAAIAMFDDKMRYLAVSRRFLFDYKLPAAAEVIGRSHYEVFPDVPQRWREIHARVLAGEELGHEEDPFPRLDGRFELVQWSMKPWRTADGRIGGALLFSQFMTRTLADSEARFQVTFENAAVGIAHVAPEGRLLKVTKHCAVSSVTLSMNSFVCLFLWAKMSPSGTLTRNRFNF